MRLEFFKKLGITNIESEIITEFKLSEINSKTQVNCKIKYLAQKYCYDENLVREIISKALLSTKT